jgi:hypothetical protein
MKIEMFCLHPPFDVSAQFIHVQKELNITLRSSLLLHCYHSHPGVKFLLKSYVCLDTSVLCCGLDVYCVDWCLFLSLLRSSQKRRSGRMLSWWSLTFPVYRSRWGTMQVTYKFVVSVCRSSVKWGKPLINIGTFLQYVKEIKFPSYPK